MSDVQPDMALPVTDIRKEKSNYWLLGIAVILLVLIFDQALKYWVKHHMELHTEKAIAGQWFLFHFTENNGMAFGLELGGQSGKLILSIFRILAVIFGFWYLKQMINKKSHRGFIVCICLILAGAMGNIIDSMFYGIWYKSVNTYEGGFLLGRVVDMLYFPLVEGHYPAWFPVKAGQPFIFFSPVFNLADASISTGVIAIFVFQRRFFKRQHHNTEAPVTNGSVVSTSDEIHTTSVPDAPEEQQSHQKDNHF